MAAVLAKINYPSHLLHNIIIINFIMQRSGDFVDKRKLQQKTWMWTHIELELRYRCVRVCT